MCRMVWMRSLSLVSAVLSLSLAAADPLLQDVPIAAPLRQSLDGSAWTLTSGALSVPATVPGDVVTDLQAAGLIGDPLVGNGTRAAAPLWDLPWTYSTQFDAPPGFAGAPDGASLVLDGAKMVADVFLNGVALGDVRSQFLRYVIPLPRALLRAAGNALAITFAPAADARNVEGRFMACSGGWDWAPQTLVRTPPCPPNASASCAHAGLAAFSRGLWKSVYLIALPAGSAALTALVPAIFYAGAYPTAPLGDAANGPWTVRVRVHALAPPGGAAGVLTVAGDWPGAGARASRAVALPAGNSTVELELVARDVALWWPAGAGAGRAFYAVNASFVPSGGGGGALAVSDARRVGFRALSLVTGDDSAALAGRDGSGNLTLRYRVNGADWALRGANLVPLDALEGRASAAAARRLLASAADAGMNALRVWGGGAFQSDAFYDAADDAGVLLLHDLMFANNDWAPSASSTVADEVRHNVRRLASHAALASWHGCNECEPHVAFNGNVVGLALPIVAQEDASRPLWPASPSAGWAGGVDMRTGLPNGRPLRAMRGAPAPAPAPALGGGGGGCALISNATVAYKSASDATLAGLADADACCAACLALPADACATALWDGASCFIRGSALLDTFWASAALWPARNGPAPRPPADYHGPYYAPAGWPTIDNPGGGGGAPWADAFPAALPAPGAAPLGARAPGQFNSELGAVGAPSFESLAPALAPPWGLHAPDMYIRNYACDSALAGYFPAAPPGFAAAAGAAAFRGQLFLCAVAQAAKLEALLAPRRAANVWGALLWQLNEIWPTVSWGTLEHGTAGFTRGQVAGGRWRPAHYLLARSLLRNVFAAVAPDGRLLLRNDHPLEPLAGVATFALTHTLTGAPRGAPLALHVALPRGPAAALWDCLTGGNATTGCAPLADWLAARGCARDGTDCVVRVAVVDAAGAVALETTVALAAPGAVALPPGTAAAVTAAVARAANADGSVNVTVAAAASAMWVHLTTAAAGRFSDSAFHLFGASERTVAFIPWDADAAAAFADTLRVEHLRTYY
jgi:beta-mannosidase